MNQTQTDYWRKKIKAALRKVRMHIAHYKNSAFDRTDAVDTLEIELLKKVRK